jgi:hypothetical protein
MVAFVVKEELLATAAWHRMLSGHQWVLSGSSVTLQLTVDYVLYVETARLDAIVVVELTVVDRMMLGLTSLHSRLRHYVLPVHMVAAWR